MKTLLRTSISLLTVISLTLGNAPLVFATSITGETIKTAPTVPRSTTKNPPIVDGFAIKVIGGSASPLKAKKGIKVTVNAGATPTGKVFTGWTSNCDLEFADPNAKSTTFTMPGHAIILQAHFKEIITASTSSNVIVAHSYRNNFELEKETLNAKQKSDGSVVATLVLPTQMNRSSSVQAQLVEADLIACIATGKAFLEKNNISSGLEVEVQLPIAPEYMQITMKLPQTIWNIMQTENISSFTIASREGAFEFNQSAISAMSTQNKMDSRLIFDYDPPSTPSERTIYKFKILYEGENGTANDINHFIMPASGIKATLPFVIKDDRYASKVTIMGVNGEGVSQKVGGSYSLKLEAITLPIGSYTSYSVGID